MTRIWKVQETGTVGNVQVAIPANALANPTRSYLVVSSDNVFDAADEYMQLTPLVINGVNHLVAVRKILNYGPVLHLCYRPESAGRCGSSCTCGCVPILVLPLPWMEQPSMSGMILAPISTHATQRSRLPVSRCYRNIAGSNINFNPVVTFNGTGQRMILDGIKNCLYGVSARTVIALTGNATIASP